MSGRSSDLRTGAAGAGVSAVGTRIVATLGPASASPDVLRRLIEAGMDVARLNFSHGSRGEHQAMIDALRGAAGELRSAVAVMGDLCGPKIRLAEIEGGETELKRGHKVRLVREKVTGSADRLSLNQPEILGDIEIGDRVLIDDGAVRLRAVARDEGGVTCECELGGPIRDHKGVNLPDTDLRLGALTDKDHEDARWAVDAGVDYLALSFVRRVDDVHALRRLLEEWGADTPIVTKVETPQAVDDIDAIIEASDAILVARGDLGVEMDVACVPRVQKEIVDRCREAGKPVIVATQMLQSMVDSAVPTRAEVSDVANAIVDGADAVMLSAETAIGKYPLEAVRMMRRIAGETEAYDQDRMRPVELAHARPAVTAAVARSISTIARELAAAAVVLWTENGTLARLASKHRLDMCVLALTCSERTLRRCALYYGIRPVIADRGDGAGERFETIDRVLTDNGAARPGDVVVVGFSPDTLELGRTGSISIHVLEEGPADGQRDSA